MGRKKLFEKRTGHIGNGLSVFTGHMFWCQYAEGRAKTEFSGRVLNVEPIKVENKVQGVRVSWKPGNIEDGRWKETDPHPVSRDFGPFNAVTSVSAATDSGEPGQEANTSFDEAWRANKNAFYLVGEARNLRLVFKEV